VPLRSKSDRQHPAVAPISPLVSQCPFQELQPAGPALGPHRVALVSGVITVVVIIIIITTIYTWTQWLARHWLPKPQSFLLWLFWGSVSCLRPGWPDPQPSYFHFQCSWDHRPAPHTQLFTD
jgi:hypothetical protein